MVSSTAPALQSSAPLFPYDKWGRALPALARQYRDNYPCPHIRLIDFLTPETASAMADEFPHRRFERKARVGRVEDADKALRTFQQTDRSRLFQAVGRERAGVSLCAGSSRRRGLTFWQKSGGKALYSNQPRAQASASEF